MPSTFTLERTTNVRSAEMREAARFVRYLRDSAQHDYDSGGLAEWWRAYRAYGYSRFTEIAESISGYSLYACGDCDQPQWGWSWFGLAEGVGLELCNVCVSNLYYCEECEEYSREAHDHEEDDDEPYSDCVAPHRSFRFPIPGAGFESVANDQRFVVEVGGGVISDSGMTDVYYKLLDDRLENRHPELHSLLFQPESSRYVGREWTNQDGNFPKRIAKRYLQAGRKLTIERIAEIGNIARRNTSQPGKHAIEFTRELDGSASDFYHAGSCWWTDYAWSRCILKQCGGLAIRTWTAEDKTFPLEPVSCACEDCQREAANRRSRVEPAGVLTSRAWIVPLDSTLSLTDDPMNASAFVLFNPYGIDGYEYARLLAQLTDKSYKRINFSLSNAYINDERGFLVADMDTCERTSGCYLSFDRKCRCAR